MKENELYKKVREMNSIPENVSWNSEIGWRAYRDKYVYNSKRTKYYIISAIAAAIVLGLFIIVPIINNKSFSSWETRNNETREIKVSNEINVVLNKNSKLTYNRRLGLIEMSGEAFFKISSGSDIQLAFNEEFVKVKEADFNVKYRKNSKQVFICVEKGQVNCVYDNTKLKILNGEQAVIISQMAITKEPISNPNYKSWFTKEFVFDNTPLCLVIEQLENVFETNIEFLDNRTRYCTIDISIKSSDVEEIIDKISLDRSYGFIKVDNRYIVTGDGC